MMPVFFFSLSLHFFLFKGLACNFVDVLEDAFASIRVYERIFVLFVISMRRTLTFISPLVHLLSRPMLFLKFMTHCEQKH